MILNIRYRNSNNIQASYHTTTQIAKIFRYKINQKMTIHQQSIEINRLNLPGIKS